MISGLHGVNGILAGVVAVIVVLVLTVLNVFAWVRILAKAGYSGWWVVAGFVPVVNLILFFVFAFAEWPIRRRLL